nr:penicillin-binding protein 2 [Allonocardiopsis opalescens]
MVVVLLIFGARLVQIQGFEAAAYAQKAEESRLQDTQIPAMRGDITDAEGNPLAMTVETRTVFVDPTRVLPEERAAVIELLATELGRPVEEITEHVDAAPSQYQVVARDVPTEQAERILEHDLGGIATERDFQRRYPNGEVAANLVGFVGADGSGLEGLEYSLEDTLAGTPGEQRVEIADGVPIPMAGGLVREPVPGGDVRLTLDRDIQWHAQNALAQQVEELGASSGSVVVMDLDQRLLALANYPTYNLDDVEASTPEQRRNGAVADTFEPGSTNKVITAAAALEEGLITPETEFTVPYSITRHGSTFSDSSFHPTENLTATGIMAHSSNTGTVQIAEEVGAETLHSYLTDFGFAQETGLGLPGESPGVLHPVEDWWGTSLATISYGQGLSVNAVQAASVYATVANGGVRVQPSIVAGATGPDGRFRSAPAPEERRVISEETADQLAYMLESVTTDEGTAPQAQIPGYRVAGKTGTAQRVNPETGSYEDGGHTSTFVGFAPADDPQVVVQVVIHDPPAEDPYGGPVAGPVFNDVMSFALQTLQVPPTETEAPDFQIYGGE